MCDENPAEVERLDLPETDEAAQKTADDRTGNADEDRDKEPSWVFPRHDGESPAMRPRMSHEKMPIPSF